MSSTLNPASQYYIYCRKSSESEERQVLSIESQIKELEVLTKRLGLHVSQILTESRSAKYPGRPVFNDLMKKVYKGQVKGVICWKLDRLARNPIDGSSLIWALDQGKLSSIITPHNTFSNNSNDKFLMQIEFGMAKKYVDDLSDNVKRGNKAKLERGWVPGLPPLGYLNEPKERTIIIDPERFPLVRKIWDLLLRGMPPSEILRTANHEWGFRTRTHKKVGNRPLTASGLYKIFSRPFYYGLIARKEGVFQGKHQTMITEEEFWKAQEILGRRGLPRPKEHHFAFTGLIRCAECGCMITAEEKRNRYGYHYAYYRCTKKKPNVRCSQKYLSDKMLESQIMDYLEKIYIPKRLLDLALDYLKAEREEENAKSSEVRKSLLKAKSDCEKKLDNLNQMRLRDLIGDKEYLKEKERLLNEKIRLEESIEKGDGNESIGPTVKTQEAILFSHTARDDFNKATPEKKKALVQELGSNFSLKDKKLLIEVEKPFAILEMGLKRINNEITPLEPQNKGAAKREFTLSASAIQSLWTTVEDVRTFYKHQHSNTTSYSL
jgi:site-specific DNA recombinase